MTISQAIKKAMDKGYVCRKLNRLDFAYMVARPNENENLIPLILLDPLFWQALGKAMGWGGDNTTPIEKSFREWIKCNLKKISPEEFKDSNHVSFHTFYETHKKDCIKANRIYISRKKAKKKKMWIYHWHRLIDHLAEGGTIESYFEKL